jgi:hypothetical protein
MKHVVNSRLPSTYLPIQADGQGIRLALIQQRLPPGMSLSYGWRLPSRLQTMSGRAYHMVRRLGIQSFSRFILF